MKKPLLIFIFIIIMLTSCSVKPAEPDLNFSARIKASFDGTKISGRLIADKHNIVNLTLSSPSSMKGCSYSYKNSKVRIKYKNMKLQADDNYLPDTAFPQIIYNVLKALNKGKYTLKTAHNSFAEYKGKSLSGSFTIKTVLRSGRITQIKLKDRKLTIRLN